MELELENRSFTIKQEPEVQIDFDPYREAEYNIFTITDKRIKEETSYQHHGYNSIPETDSKDGILRNTSDARMDNQSSADLKNHFHSETSTLYQYHEYNAIPETVDSKDGILPNIDDSKPSDERKGDIKPANATLIKKSFECIYCSFNFRTLNGLLCHQTNNNESISRLEEHRCIPCNREFSSQVCKQFHLIDFHLPKNHIKCQLCPMQFQNWIYYAHHLRFTHLSTACSQCDSKFSDKMALINHQNHHKNPREVMVYRMKSTTFPQGTLGCSLCDFMTKTDRLLTIHIRSFHNPELKFECEFCTRRFSTGLRLDGHLKYHSVFRKSTKYPVVSEKRLPLVGRLRLNERPRNVLKTPTNIIGNECDIKKGDHFQCIYCSRIFWSFDALKGHMEYDKPGVKRCLECNRDFPSYVCYVHHFDMIHLAVNPVKCLWCPIMFNNTAKYDTHRRHVHSIFKCKLCDAQFGKQHELQKHHDRHLDKEFSTCKICSKVLITRKALNRHIKRNSCSAVQKNTKVAQRPTQITYM